MVEVIGDPVYPSELIIPTIENGAAPPTMSGALIISGGLLVYIDATGTSKELTGT